MITKQLTVFLSNTSGRLLDLTKVLGAANVNIQAMSIAETADYGIVRMIVDDTDKGLKALEAAEFTAKAADVIKVETPDEPGALANMLQKLSVAGVDVSYLYGYSRTGISYLIVKVSDPQKALALL